MKDAQAARGSADLLETAKPLYLLPRDDLADEVLIPAFGCASAASCMVGFFSSAVLADLAPGLATYIAKAGDSFRLIVSPYLSDEDQSALLEGVADPEQAVTSALLEQITTTDALQRHTLKCLSYLLARRRVEIKVALMREGLFHPKVWLFHTPRGVFAAHGSSNMTRSALRRNKEQITISRAWSDPTQRYVADTLVDEFTRLWANRDDDCLVLDLPQAVERQILQDFPADRPPTEGDFRELFRRASSPRVAVVSEPDSHLDFPAPPVFRIPTSLRYDDGPFAHQGAAVRAWIEAGCRGTLEMATGSGKTITAMIAAYRLYERHRPLLIVVAAPYVPLIEQWCGEVSDFGLQPLNLSAVATATQRNEIIRQSARRLRLGLADVAVLVVSHDTLCTPAFQDAVRTFDCHRLLVADEAHNLGRASFVGAPPDFFQSRLALSATPVRQYDPDGSDALLTFFGPVIFRFTLREAIGVCLVEYDYHVHPVQLTHQEMDAWSELTSRIRQNSWRSSNGQPDDYLSQLFRERRALLETAQGKLAALDRLLAQQDLRSMRHTLVYATDKAPEQLLRVNALLNDRGVLFHQLTAEETADRRRAMEIIRAFQCGDIQALTAKRVLDEGVNIPQIRTAYILASTTVERQWVQRRGRLLRSCREIDKSYSVIHDFVVIPPTDGYDDDARSLVRGELHRMQEFASLARNAGRDDGPLPLIHHLVKAALM